jgi:hypothetical protein
MSMLDYEFREALRRLRAEDGRLGEARKEVTVRQMEAMALEFRDLLVEAGVVSLADVNEIHCGRYIYGVTARGGPPAEHTVVNRRVVLRHLLADRRSDIQLDPATVVAPVPSRPPQSCRPLTDKEMILARDATPHGVEAARLALTQACISTGRVCDFGIGHLDDPADPHTVTDDEGRVYTLTKWGSQVLAERVANLDGDPGTPLAYEGREGSGPGAKPAAASKGLRQVLDAAGLSGDDTVMPMSITYWGAVRQRRLGASPEAVAQLLGIKVKSLPVFLR